MEIYNSRNYSILLNYDFRNGGAGIYNSRNYSILLNIPRNNIRFESTTVEIILYYLTHEGGIKVDKSTTVEIILYYLTFCLPLGEWAIYNSRNYSILLNCLAITRSALSTTVEIILYYLTPNLCICTIFWSQTTLFLLFYITFAQYMLSNIDYYKIKVQVCITL